MSSKQSPSDWIGDKPDDPKPIVYLSGVARSIGLSPEKLYELTQYRFYCLSYLYCAPTGPRFLKAHGEALVFYLKNNLRVFLDSGAHTFHELAYAKLGTRGKAGRTATQRLATSATIEDTVEAYATGYAKWLREQAPKSFDFYVNLDYLIHAPTIYKMLHHLQDDHKIAPIPVYHGDSSIDWLQKYIDEGHRLVGIGWNPAAHGRPQRRRYYDKVFDFAAKKKDLRLHGFACTGTEMFAYPWYSVDSTTWLKSAAYGGILDFVADSQGYPRFKMSHVSERKLPASLHNDPELLARAESRGFNPEELRNSCAARALFNIKSYQIAADKFTARSSRVSWKGSLC